MGRDFILSEEQLNKMVKYVCNVVKYITFHYAFLKSNPWHRIDIRPLVFYYKNIFFLNHLNIPKNCPPPIRFLGYFQWYCSFHWRRSTWRLCTCRWSTPSVRTVRTSFTSARYSGTSSSARPDTTESHRAVHCTVQLICVANCINGTYVGW